MEKIAETVGGTLGTIVGYAGRPFLKGLKEKVERMDIIVVGDEKIRKLQEEGIPFIVAPNHVMPSGEVIESKDGFSPVGQGSGVSADAFVILRVLEEMGLDPVAVAKSDAGKDLGNMPFGAKVFAALDRALGEGKLGPLNLENKVLTVDKSTIDGSPISLQRIKDFAKKAILELERRRPLLMFYEGDWHKNRDTAERPVPENNGTAILARRAGAMIVPTFVTDTDRFNPKPGVQPKVYFGDPISTINNDGTRKPADQLTQELHEAVTALRMEHTPDLTPIPMSDD